MKNQGHGIMKLIFMNFVKTALLAFAIFTPILVIGFHSDFLLFLKLYGMFAAGIILYSILTVFLLYRDVVTPLEFFLSRFEKVTEVDYRACSMKPSRRLYGALCQIEVAMRKLLESKTKASAELSSKNEELGRVYNIIEKSPIVVFEWSIEPGTPVNYVSENIRKYGYEPSEFISGTLDYWDMLHPEDVAAAQQKIWNTRKLKDVMESRQTYRVICKDGTVKWVEELTYYERDAYGNQVMEKGILSDVTEMKMAEAKITWLTYHDKLTGLYNRTWVEDRFAALDLEINRAVSIMIGDMNGLKLINDLLGHKAGDELLKAMSIILRKSVRGTNYEVARLGGDEFVIIMPDADEAAAEALAASIKTLCNHKISGSFTPSISWGYSGRGENERKLIDLIFKEADHKMYITKDQDSRDTKVNVLKSIQDSFNDSVEKIERDQDMDPNKRKRAKQSLSDRFEMLLQYRNQVHSNELNTNEERLKNFLEKRYSPDIVNEFLESIERKNEKN